MSEPLPTLDPVTRERQPFTTFYYVDCFSADLNTLKILKMASIESDVHV